LWVGRVIDVIQIQNDALNGLFASILNTIPVGVDPDSVADFKI